MKEVFYHQENQPPKKFAVLNENKDGTIDIGPVGGEPVVTGCKLLKVPTPGSATTVPVGVTKPTEDTNKK